jgi:DNA-binding response OmpR family regulator
MANILLVDDDVLVVKSIKRLLEQNGYSVEIAKSGAEGLEKLRSGCYDLVICDIRMPGVSGIATAKELREGKGFERNSSVPFIFITGYASEEAPIEAIKLKAADYILKPFDVEELLTSVKKHILAS